MSVGWLKVRRTDYETFEKQKIMPHALSIILGHLVCLSWHAYFKPKDHQIKLRNSPWSYNLGKNHGKWSSKPPNLPPKQIMDETVKIGLDGLLNWYINAQWVHSWGSDSPYTTLLGTACRWACQCCLWYPEMGSGDISVKPIDERVKSCSCN